MLVDLLLYLGICPDTWLLSLDRENVEMCPEMGIYHVLPNTIVLDFPN